jgi:hypothetical protein
LLPRFAVGVGRKQGDGGSEVEAAVTVLPPPFASVVRGVGISHTTSVSVRLVVVVVGFGACLRAVALRDPLESPTTGVGTRAGTRVSSDGRTVPPELADWLLPYGVAVGVGSVSTAVGNCPSCPPPRQSQAAGVGRPSGEEQPLPLVGGADIGRS